MGMVLLGHIGMPWYTSLMSGRGPVVTAAVRLIVEHAIAHDLDSIQIALHGGEPLLAGPRLPSGSSLKRFRM